MRTQSFKNTVNKEEKTRHSGLASEGAVGGSFLDCFHHLCVSFVICPQKELTLKIALLGSFYVPMIFKFKVPRKLKITANTLAYKNLEIPEYNSGFG